MRVPGKQMPNRSPPLTVLEQSRYRAVFAQTLAVVRVSNGGKIMPVKLFATAFLVAGLAGSAFAQSTPAPSTPMTDMNQMNSEATPKAPTTPTVKKKTHKVHQVRHTTGKHTAKNFNKQNCKSISGKNSLQTQGGNSNTENTENTCADNNN
jgi:hypothetical protein